VTPTRPLSASFAAVLAQLAERGPLHSYALRPVAVNPAATLSYLVEAGFVKSERVTVPPLNRYLFHITDLGRSVLASGVVERKPTRPPLTPFAVAGFTATAPPRRNPVARVGCVHLWSIGNDLAQTGKCQKCETTKEFRPRFSAGLAMVGGGRVRKSERFAGVSR
jgi:hypothetical protein